MAGYSSSERSNTTHSLLLLSCFVTESRMRSCCLNYIFTVISFFARTPYILFNANRCHTCMIIILKKSCKNSSSYANCSWIKHTCMSGSSSVLLYITRARRPCTTFGVSCSLTICAPAASAARLRNISRCVAVSILFWYIKSNTPTAVGSMSMGSVGGWTPAITPSTFKHVKYYCYSSGFECYVNETYCEVK